MSDRISYNSEGEEDEVLAEVPVYLSHALAEKLYLLQYPMRPSSRPYQVDMTGLEGARIKPTQQRMELEYNISSRMGVEAETQPTLRLASDKVQAKTNYAVGVIKDGKLVLHPLHATVRMKPCMQYIDMRDEEKKEDTMAIETESSREEKKQVVMKVKARENSMLRKPTVQQLKEEAANEEWIELSPKAVNSAESESHKELLYRVDGNDDLIDQVENNGGGEEIFNMDREGFIQSVMSSQQPTTGSMDVETDPSLNRTNEIRKRISELLLRAKVAGFKTICEKCKIQTADEVEDALTHLQRIAYYVRGGYVIRSSEFVERNTRFFIAREYLIALFAKSECIRIRDVSSTLRLTLEQVMELFKELSVPVPEQDCWKFRMPEDQKFIQCFPQIYDQHQQELEELLHESQQDLGKTRSDSNHTSVLYGDQSNRNQPRQGSNQQTLQFVTNILDTYGVCRLEFIEEQMKMTPFGVTSTDGILSALESIAVQINNRFVRKSLNTPGLDEVRNVVLELFCHRERIRKSDIRSAVMEVGLGHLSDSAYMKIIRELAISSKGGWELKNGMGECMLTH